MHLGVFIIAMVEVAFYLYTLKFMIYSFLPKLHVELEFLKHIFCLDTNVS